MSMPSSSTFKASNNEDMYEHSLSELNSAIIMANSLTACFDLKLMAIYLTNNYKAQDETMMASSSIDGRSKQIQQKVVKERSINATKVISLDMGHSQMDPLVKYLSNRELPQDKKEAEWIKKGVDGSSL